jgi:sugar (pentulose or hexulose) kinase
MTATNSVAPRTGNVSAGTSSFAMIVLEKPLSHFYPEIDIVATPSGLPVAMVHTNTCTSDIDAWVSIFAEAFACIGGRVEKGTLYDALYGKALEGDADCGGLLSYNFYAGEPVAGIAEGRPLFVRKSGDAFTLANFVRSLLYSALGTLKLGMDILIDNEKVRLDCLYGHGGFFKTPHVGQSLMASALGVPVAVMQSAGEGGPWGMALLAAYMARKTNGESLGDFLKSRVFGENGGRRVEPDKAASEGFAAFMARYKSGLAVEKAAAAALP